MKTDKELFLPKDPEPEGILERLVILITDYLPADEIGDLIEEAVDDTGLERETKEYEIAYNDHQMMLMSQAYMLLAQKVIQDYVPLLAEPSIVVTIE